MTTTTVSSTEALLAALETAKSGDTIKLQPGDYGEVLFRDLSFDTPVTITSQDPSDQAVFGGIRVWNAHGVTFDRLTIDMVPDAETTEVDAGFRADESSFITLSNSYIEGGLSVAGIDPDSEPGSQGMEGILGMPVGRGVMMRATENFVLHNNEITQFNKGIVVNDIENAVFSENYIHHTRSSPLTGQFGDNIEITGNYFTDIFPWKFGGLGDHGDMIHIYTRANTTDPAENILIRDNVFKQGDGEAILGIYLDDNNFGIGFRNVVIEDNLIHNGDAQGIRFEYVTGARIENNTLLPSDSEPNSQPGIYFRDNSTDIDVINNIYGTVNYGNDGTTPGAIRLKDNLLVQNANPNVENFVGDLFANALAENPTLADLVAKPGIDADGVGAALTQPGASGLTVGFILDAEGEGLDMRDHALAIFDAYGPLGKINLSGATITWDLGDGQTKTGQSISHSYDIAGTYTVTAQVQTASGQTYAFDKVIKVQSPDAIWADFEGRIDDRSDIENDSYATGPIQFQTSDTGKALRLANEASHLTYARNQEILDNESYSMTVSFRKDSAEDGGRLLYFSGTGVLTLGRNSLDFRASTSTGDNIILRDLSAGISDTQWHTVTATYSSDTGVARLYLDGQEIVEQTGLSGIQATTGGHELHVGSPFGGSFTGLVDNLHFSTVAMNAQEVAAFHTALANGEAVVPTPLPDPDPAPTPDPEPDPQPDPGPEFTVDDISFNDPGEDIAIDPALIEAAISDGSFGFEIMLDPTPEGVEGALFWLPATVFARINAQGELVVVSQLEGGGTIETVTSGAALGDGVSHKIGIQYFDDQLELLVDDVVVLAKTLPAPLNVASIDRADDQTLQTGVASFEVMQAAENGFGGGTSGAASSPDWTGDNFGGSISGFSLLTDATSSPEGGPTVVPRPDPGDTPAKLAHIGEVHTLSLDHKAKTFTLDGTYDNPVVIAKSSSFNGSDPVDVRVLSVGSDRVTLALDEADYLDGWHKIEDVTLFVMEAGSHVLADGTRIEAGTLDTNATTVKRQDFETVSFETDFDDTPTILSQVQSMNQNNFVITRQTDKDTDGFGVALQQEEGRFGEAQAVETIGWVAMERGAGDLSGLAFEAGTTGRSFDHTTDTHDFDAAFDTAPILLAGLSSTYGGDSAMLRVSAVDEDGFAGFVQEEQSANIETRHVQEDVDYIAFGDTGALMGYSADENAPTLLDDAIVPVA